MKQDYVERVGVRGFKALVNVEVELGLLNVFIGSNGSGKTSLLEALGLLSAAAHSRVDDLFLLQRGVRLGQPSVYKTALEEEGRIPRYIHLEAEGWGFRYRVDLDNPVKRPDKTWRFANEWFGQVKPEEKLVGRSPRSALDPTQGSLGLAELPEAAQPLREALRSYRIYTPQTAVLRGVAQDPVPQAPWGLHGGGLAETLDEWFRQQPEAHEQVREALREWFDWVDDVEVASTSKRLVPPSLPMSRKILVFTDRYARQGRNQMTAYDASEGVLHVLFLLALVLHPDAPPLAAVDNVGYGLHPRLKRVVIRWVADRLLEYGGRQLLLTTHDPLILDGLPLLDSRVRLFVVERRPNGAVEVRRITVDEELWKKKEERGWALSDLWVEGWLGGVPNLW